MKKEIIWSSECTPMKFVSNQGIFKEDKEEELNDDGEELIDFEDIKDRLEIKKILQTSLGNFVVEDAMSPIHHLSFWRFDTNFSITERIQNELAEIEGVEILRILGRYSGCLAVGKAFNIRTVRSIIDEKICGHKVSTSKEDEELKKLKEELSPFTSWAIYRLPNGQLDYTWLEPDNSNSENFIEKVKLFTEAKKISNGDLIRNE